MLGNVVSRKIAFEIYWPLGHIQKRISRGKPKIRKCSAPAGKQSMFGIRRNGILLPKMFWPTLGINCFSNREKNLLKFEAEGQEFAKSLEQFIPTVKGQNSFW